MPSAPRQRFYNRLNKLHRDLRRTRTDYSTICPKQRARKAINQIEQICERDITSQSAIIRAQNEITDVLTDVAFALENLSHADRDRPGVPTKGDIFRYLASDVTKLAFVWIRLPPKDKDAIRRATERSIKPVLRRGAEMLRPIIAPTTSSALSNSVTSNKLTDERLGFL
jgi:hypothetical protein